MGRNKERIHHYSLKDAIGLICYTHQHARWLFIAVGAQI
jgi:hypothetical protein